MKIFIHFESCASFNYKGVLICFEGRIFALSLGVTFGSHNRRVASADPSFAMRTGSESGFRFRFGESATGPFRLQRTLIPTCRMMFAERMIFATRPRRFAINVKGVGVGGWFESLDWMEKSPGNGIL